MARNSRVEMIGSEADLQGGPRDVRPDAFTGGRVEMVGSEAEMPRRTTPMGEFDKGVRDGRVEMVGSETELHRTPRRGWESHSTPISDNSENANSTSSSYPRAGNRSGR